MRIMYTIELRAIKLRLCAFRKITKRVAFFELNSIELIKIVAHIIESDQQYLCAVTTRLSSCDNSGTIKIWKEEKKIAANTTLEMKNAAYTLIYMSIGFNIYICFDMIYKPFVARFSFLFLLFQLC